MSGWLASDGLTARKLQCLPLLVFQEYTVHFTYAHIVVAMSSTQSVEPKYAKLPTNQSVANENCMSHFSSRDQGR